MELRPDLAGAQHFENTLLGLGPYEVNGMVTCDEAHEQYVAYIFNSMLPQMVTYRGTWKDAQTLAFEIENSAALHRWQRVLYTKLDDGEIRFYVETSHDGEHYAPHSESVLSRTVK